MRPTPRAARACAAAALAWSLCGCISLLPKEKPVQLYRFGYSAPPSQAAASGAPGFLVQQAPMTFERPAAGDLILAITGDEAAYIADARWVASAASLFESAVARAFDASGGPARLIPRATPVRAQYALKLDVRRFETRYDHGREQPPTVEVELYAALINRGDDAPTRSAEHIFQASVPASENRAGAIARAYDVAVDRVLNDMVAWVGGKGA